MRTLAAAIVGVAALRLLAGCEPPVDPTVKETEVKILRETVGVGQAVAPEDMVTINYQVAFPSGEVVLSGSKFRFVVGADAVIQGIDDAVRGMRIGGRRTVEIPPHKHWGREGYGGGAIPPSTTLTAHLELLSID